MNKLFLTIALTFSTMIASAQFSVLTTVTETADSAWSITDKIGVGYNLNDCAMIGVTTVYQYYHMMVEHTLKLRLKI